MEKELNISNTISINAEKSKVWEILTQPEWTRQYMFGCDVITDWKPGNPVLWQGEMNGEKIVYVKGNVVEYKHNDKIRYTVFPPGLDLEDIPENYLTVTYELSDTNGQTRLTISEGDFSKVANGKQRYAETLEGGDTILVKIKELAESN